MDFETLIGGVFELIDANVQATPLLAYVCCMGFCYIWVLLPCCILRMHGAINRELCCKRIGSRCVILGGLCYFLLAAPWKMPRAVTGVGFLRESWLPVKEMENLRRIEVLCALALKTLQMRSASVL